MVSALEFRCCKVIPLVNHKITFDERIGCITRQDGFSPRSHRAVSLKVALFLRDCKARGYRRRDAVQTENDWVYSYLIQVNIKYGFYQRETSLVSVQHCRTTHFAQWQITDISIVNDYFVCIDFWTGGSMGQSVNKAWIFRISLKTILR